MLGNNILPFLSLYQYTTEKYLAFIHFDDNGKFESGVMAAYALYCLVFCVVVAVLGPEY